MFKNQNNTTKSQLNQKEKELIELAQIAWNKTLKDYFFPPLNLPNFVFDYTHKEGFYIDPQYRWQITMNLANTPIFIDREEYTNYYYIISLHEVSHYVIIPYDGLINARLLKAAMKHVNRSYAPIIVNLFADLIIDTKLHKKHPDLIKWELKVSYEQIQRNYKSKINLFSKLIFYTYENLFNIKIIEDDESSEIARLAKQIAKVVLSKFEDETLWERKVEKIARILKPLISDTFLISKGGKKVKIPEDTLELMDNPLENKNIDKLKENNEAELTKKAEIFARETPYSEFGAPANEAGIMVDKNPLATWYRGIAKNLIEIKIYEKRSGEKITVYPELWRIGDSIEKLDIVQTLLTNPIIIPNITTRKWAQEAGAGFLNEKAIPDLLLIVDSSGSMNWNYSNKKPKGQYHTALISSFAALHYAAKKGVKFSVINFSNKPEICDWTDNYHEAERILLRYQGGGTNLPINAVYKQCEKAEKRALILIITDFGIYNWTKAKKILAQLSDQGHKIIGFFIGTAKIPKKRFKDLLDKVSFYPIKNAKKLINLVVKEVKKYYI